MPAPDDIFAQWLIAAAVFVLAGWLIFDFSPRRNP